MNRIPYLLAIKLLKMLYFESADFIQAAKASQLNRSTLQNPLTSLTLTLAANSVLSLPLTIGLTHG